MIDTDQLRLAATLVHAVPGAELCVGCDGGDRLTVSRHPAADLAPCAFRQLVVEATRFPARGSGGRPLAIERLDLGGSLVDLGGGVVRTALPCGREQRWLATTLPWKVVRDLLVALECDTADGVDATIAPDPDAGAVLVRLESTGASISVLDRTAADLSAALLVEELAQSIAAAP